MKLVKSVCLAAIFVAGTFLTSSCGTPFPLGCLYTQVTLPVAVGGGDMVFNRIGSSSCHSFLGWVAGGDASINAAALAGDINYVTWANQEVINVLGIYGVYKTVVWGFGDAADPSVKAAAGVKEAVDAAASDSPAEADATADASADAATATEEE